MQTVNQRAGGIVRLGGVALMLGALAGAPGPAAAADSEVGIPAAALLAEREGALLHRRIDLSAVRLWSRATHGWRPVGASPARVTVLNLWSIHCQPCLAEFPLLKRIVDGWRGRADVRFLFIADPPSDTSAAELAAFWDRSLQALPDVDPGRATTDALRRSLESELQPITLLLDEKLVVRQAFVGAVTGRSLGTAIERLLRASEPRPRHR